MIVRIQLNSIVHFKMKLLFVSILFIRNNPFNQIFFFYLDFGLTYCSNGDLLQYITDAGHFEEDVVRFYAAELIEAVEQLHARNIIHRDLKVHQVFLSSCI